MLQNLHATTPDMKQWVVVENYSSKERIISESQLKSVFTDERWQKITSGLDDYFSAYEYNFSESARGFNL
jgi:hypothetical protein